MSINEILELPTQERLNIVEQIWASIDTDSIEITDAQKKELDRRLDLDKSGDMPYYTWEEVKASLKKEK